MEIFKTKRTKRKVPNYFSINQIERLFDAIDDPRLAMVCLLAYTTGMRRGEVASLKTDNIKLEERKIKIEAAKSGDDYVIVPESIIPILKKWIRLIGDNEYLFPSRKPNTPHITGQGFIRYYTMALKKAGLHQLDYVTTDDKKRYRYSFHTLRHSYCTFLMEQGIQPQIVQKLMRHSKIKTTIDYYTHIPDPTTRNYADAAFSVKTKPKAETEVQAPVMIELEKLKLEVEKMKLENERLRLTQPVTIEKPKIKSDYIG